MTDNKMLTKKEYARIRYKAKKMGAKNVHFCAMWNSVSFQHTTVLFVFHPFKVHANINDGHFMTGQFSDTSTAEAIKRDIDVALEFIEYLKEFEKTLSK